MQRQHGHHRQEKPLPDHSDVFNNPTPSVAVLLPVYNEADSIDFCLESLAAQTYTGRWEVIAIDGGSTDGSREKLHGWTARLPQLGIIDNPERLQSHGLNRAVEQVTADVIIRADAHTTYSPDYVARSVESLRSSGAAAVGGPMRPQGTAPFSRAVAAAYRSKLGIGPAAFHHTATPVEGDTVYLGAMARKTFIANGGMRTLPSRVAEDADFYYRLRQGGGRVLIDPTIVSIYHPRATPAALWRQFYRYGLGKADMLHVNGEFPSWRPLAPLALLVGMISTLILGLFAGVWWPLLAVAAEWLVVLIIGGRGRLLTMAAIAIMHLAYGVGLLRGLLRLPSRVRAGVA